MKVHKESLGGDRNTYILTMAVVTQRYTTVKIHQTVQLKWVNCIVYKLHLGRGDKREKEREKRKGGRKERREGEREGGEKERETEFGKACSVLFSWASESTQLRKT